MLSLQFLGGLGKTYRAGRNVVLSHPMLVVQRGEWMYLIYSSQVSFTKEILRFNVENFCLQAEGDSKSSWILHYVEITMVLGYFFGDVYSYRAL